MEMKKKRGVYDCHFMFNEREKLTHMCCKYFLSPSQVQAEDPERKGCSACPQKEQDHVKLF